MTGDISAEYRVGRMMFQLIGDIEMKTIKFKAAVLTLNVWLLQWAIFDYFLRSM